VLLTMLARVGIAMSDEECMRTFVGRSAAAALAIIAERLGGPLPAGFASEWDARLFGEFGRGVAPVAGVVAALDALQAAALPTCVASSGTHERMRITLAASGLLPRFAGRLFSVTEVARGKPSPDVFLLAARTMGAAPARTLVIEDAPAGVAAGVAAGMRVLGYAGGAPQYAADLRAAGATVFRDMRELPTLVAAANSGGS
jgi:beta-phosphoglucomutase-like phosphatase (HAD superfamily)